MSSKKCGLTANDIKDGILINARNSIAINSVGNNCSIHSFKSGVEIDENAGHNLSLTARDNIKIGNIGDKCHILSTNGTVGFSNIGNLASIEARDSIKAKGIGSNSTLVSLKDAVAVQNLK